MTTEELKELALSLGFTQAGELNVKELRFLPEVREMCASDRCRSYGRCWTCPPGCGTLEEISARAEGCARGILVQSTGELEDSFDIETMESVGRLQKERFLQLAARVREMYPDCLPMSSGTCTICAVCTYPDAPCRFPERAIPSMEAYGLLVSDVCKASGLPYYYGPNTITYTACILI